MPIMQLYYLYNIIDDILIYYAIFLAEITLKLCLITNGKVYRTDSSNLETL